MRSIFATALVLALTNAEIMEQSEFEFMKYIAKWNKSYATREEFKARLGEYLRIDEFIKEVNAPDSKYSHTAAHNKFSDWTEAEYKKMLTLDNAPKQDMSNAPVFEANPDVSVPESMTWQNTSCLTRVKNQESCGSCYAFSATETVESSYCINTGTLYTLSPQQIVDCSTSYGNNGCNGGWYYSAWAYLETHGQEKESAYPYTGRDGTCQYQSSEGKVKTTSRGTQITGNIASMSAAINQQPISVAIEADRSVFQSYSSGVIKAGSGCGIQLDHAVAAVGYNLEGNYPYYIVRNSWGSSWGDNGFVNIEATNTQYGVCGINQQPYLVDTATWTG